jgi:hypothetical protein
MPTAESNYCCRLGQISLMPPGSMNKSFYALIIGRVVFRKSPRQVGELLNSRIAADDLSLIGVLRGAFHYFQHREKARR